MRHSALKRRPTHHNTNRLPHPGQAARSARKRELQRARRDRIRTEAENLGMPVSRYEDQEWRRIAPFRALTARQRLSALEEVLVSWRRQSTRHDRPTMFY